MKNEFGVRLDSNGYAPSIMTAYMDDACFICDRMGDLARHEVFHGSNREKSKALGLWVRLCPACHDRLHKKDASLDWWLKNMGQEYAMAWYDWTVDEFIKQFGRNYLDEEQIQCINGWKTAQRKGTSKGG